MVRMATIPLRVALAVRIDRVPEVAPFPTNADISFIQCPVGDLQIKSAERGRANQR